jgi:predicted flap endonuclease-1-like 5' DNA nuclease
MTALTWQTLLLLAIAYLAGCIIGFVLRRRRAVRSDEEPMRAPLRREAVEASGLAQPAASASLAADSAVRRADTGASASAMREPSGRETSPTVVRFEQALSGPARGNGPASIVEELVVTKEELPPQPKEAPKPEPRREEPAPEQEPAPVRTQERAPSIEEQPTPSADELTRIKGVEGDIARRLNALDVFSYAQIAAWSATDVARLNRELGFKGRIQRENWIEQAQVLAKGEETRFARRLARGEAAAASPIEDEGEPPLLGLPSERAATDGRAETAFSVEDERHQAGADPVVAPGNVEADTEGADQAEPEVSERAAFAHVAAATEDAADVAEQEAEQAAELAQPVAQQSTEAQTLSFASRPAAPAVWDRLQRIGTIDGELEQVLNEQGVTRYAQIAAWAPADVERFEAIIGEAGRIGRENWIEQAQILARGGDTAFSREYDRLAEDEPAAREEPRIHNNDEGEAEAEDTAPARTSDVAALRSVRSHALRGDADPRSNLRLVRPAEPDDLKRIRGIGVLIEKRLNALGIAAYEQIANWTDADIARVSDTLEFKGRIERENWVEQARILATGGQTEFSRRVDRGEVVTSRPR